MGYEYIKELEEDEAVRDVMRLHWWVNENINKEGDYLISELMSRFSNKSYINYAFKADNSIRTRCIPKYKRHIFYALMDNNKILRCTLITKLPFGESTYDFRGLYFELFNNADKYVITRNDNNIIISNDNNKVITDDEEIIGFRVNQIEIPSNIRFTDFLKPISVDDLKQAFIEARDKSDERIANKDIINADLSKVFTKGKKKKPTE